MRILDRFFCDLADWVMTKSVRYWANHYMDQFENFRFKDICGNDVFVTISYYSDFPNSHEDLDNVGKCQNKE